jgi:hypothetical protein
VGEPQRIFYAFDINDSSASSRSLEVSHSIIRLLEASRCESILSEMNAFIAEAYTEANATSRLAHVYEHELDMEAFAFPLHAPGSPKTAHLPGFQLHDLPDGLAEVCREAVATLRLEQGRVLLNVSRYPEHSGALPAHFDGELFDYTIEPGVGNTVRSGIRPSEVALLTLRNDTHSEGTTLHDMRSEDGKVIGTRAQAGELLLFDNTAWQHGVSPTGSNQRFDSDMRPPRWVRYTIGWRALEEGFYWVDGEPLRPIQFEEAIALHDQYLANDWPKHSIVDVARGTFPFPTRYV